MCTGAEVAIAGQVAGAGMSAMGARDAAKGQKSALKAEAALADTNARILEMNAQGELAAGQREEQKILLDKAQRKGSQKVAFAANGVTLDTDPTSTVNNVLTSSEVLGEIDANTAAANAIRSAWGFRLEGTNEKNRALLARASAKSINPNKAALTSLLTSASSIAGNYYGAKKVGAL